MKSDVEAIVKSLLTKGPITLKSQIVRGVESTFENTLQESYFTSNNCLTPAMFELVDQALGGVVRSDRRATVTKNRNAKSRPGQVESRNSHPVNTVQYRTYCLNCRNSGQASGQSGEKHCVRGI